MSHLLKAGGFFASNFFHRLMALPNFLLERAFFDGGYIAIFTLYVENGIKDKGYNCTIARLSYFFTDVVCLLPNIGGALLFRTLLPTHLPVAAPRFKSFPF